MKKILQKVIAESSFCSRRQAEAAIKRGEVKVNGQLAKPGELASATDEITVRGKKIGAPQEKIYLKLNKPKGYICTNRSFVNEKNIFSLIPSNIKGLFTVGRLDKNSHGLIILTNDGDLNLKLTHPRSEHVKIYEVKTKPDLEEKIIKRIQKNLVSGIPFDEDEGVAKAKKVSYLGEGAFRVFLSEGKKRQIRRMFEACGAKVSDLKRTNFASLELGGLAEGQWGYLSKSEIAKLREL